MSEQSNRSLLLTGVLLAASVSVWSAGDMRVTGCFVIDDCYDHTRDGSIDPGEFVLLQVEFTNEGDTTVEDFAYTQTLLAGGEALP